MFEGKKILFLLMMIGFAIELSACASTDPAFLQHMRIECAQKHDPWRASIDDYYLCVDGAKEGPSRGDEKANKTIDHPSKRLHDEIRFVKQAPQKDAPWLMMELGTKAFAAGEINLAHSLFGNAAQAVETIYGDSPQAQKARAAFRQEADKLFIGETHERAMVFHYLGLLDLAAGDEQNARASFRASLLQDSLSASDRFRQDFASSVWLTGWASHCVGSARAKQDFAKAEKLIGTKSPARGDNLLVVVELGQGPFKLTAGQYSEKLIYAAHKTTQIEHSWQPAQFDLFRANDLHFQATSRGDRTFDQYLKAQSEAKQTAKNVGDAALIAGLVILDTAARMANASTRNRDYSAAAGVTALVGTAALAVSGISYAVGAAINPAADTRTWRTLPRTIFLGSFKAPRRAKTLTDLKGNDPALTRLIQWIESHEEVASVFSGTLSDKGQCRLLWIRDQSSNH